MTSPPPPNHIRFRALSCILRGAGPNPPPSRGRELRGESFFYGKGSNFNELYLAHSGFQKVTRLYPMNFSSGIQLFKNIKEL